MQKDQQKLIELIKGKKVAFIGAGVSHKTLIKEFVELGAHVTLCDQKKSVEDFGDYAATIKELGIDAWSYAQMIQSMQQQSRSLQLMLGGIGSTSGMIIGAILVTILPELLRFMGDYYQLVFYGIALLLLLVYPLGLSHLFSQLKKKAAAFFAGRKKTQKEG